MFHTEQKTSTFSKMTKYFEALQKETGENNFSNLEQGKEVKEREVMRRWGGVQDRKVSNERGERLGGGKVPIITTVLRQAM